MCNKYVLMLPSVCFAPVSRWQEGQSELCPDRHAGTHSQQSKQYHPRCWKVRYEFQTLQMFQSKAAHTVVTPTLSKYWCNFFKIWDVPNCSATCTSNMFPLFIHPSFEPLSLPDIYSGLFSLAFFISIFLFLKDKPGVAPQFTSAIHYNDNKVFCSSLFSTTLCFLWSAEWFRWSMKTRNSLEICFGSTTWWTFSPPSVTSCLTTLPRCRSGQPVKKIVLLVCGVKFLFCLSVTAGHHYSGCVAVPGRNIVCLNELALSQSVRVFQHVTHSWNLYVCCVTF